MKKIIFAATAVASVAFAASAFAKTDASTPVIVSCFRGPWKAVIWDSPNDDFISSLVANGYSDMRAAEIGNTICRDPYLVDHPSAIAERTIEVMKSTPKG